MQILQSASTRGLPALFEPFTGASPPVFTWKKIGWKLFDWELSGVRVVRLRVVRVGVVRGGVVW